MPRAYVTIVTSANMSPTVIEQLDDIEAVIDAHIVAGDFDIIAELEATETSDMLPIVTKRIQGIDGVGHTRTYIVLE